ncbi:MAG: DUF3108 domain-containing protein [Candidatus Omnitrophica bacterium]|nr:DUF3108 domain-containing protein [Candidatus Omnitrophota bacterium]
MFLFVLLLGREEGRADSLPPERPAVGERLAFHGYWLAIPVGYGWIEVASMVDLDGRKAYHIHAEGHTNEVLSVIYPIHDTIDSYLDAETLQPLRFVKHQREGHYRADEVVTFDHHRHLARYESLLNGSVKEIALPDRMQDIISALYWFRAQLIQAPQTLMVDIYSDEKMFQTSVTVQSPARLELLKRGTFSCFMVEPKASFKGLLVKRARLWAHVTADRYRLPLLVKATTPWGPMSAVLDETSIPTDVQRIR